MRTFEDRYTELKGEIRLMRILQKAYFSLPSSEKLIASKKQEKIVDNLIETNLFSDEHRDFAI